MDDFIVIGEILKPQGLSGEVKVRSLTDNPMRYKKLKLVYLDGLSYKITSIRIDGVMVFLKLFGVENRDDAQKLVGKLVKIDKVNAVELPENAYFIADLIGCTVTYEDGEVLGKISSVDAFGSADVITIENDKKSIRFPHLNRVVKNVDVENKLFVVFKKQFEEVCVR